MPDPQTPNLQLYIPLRGADVGTWDVPANANFSALDAALGQTTTIGVTNVNVTLSQAQYACGTIIVNGVQTADLSLIFPAYGRSYNVINLCTNSNTWVVYITHVAGSFVCAPPGEMVTVVTDGTGFRYLGLEPHVGGYWDYAGATVPRWVSACSTPPFLNCDGAVFSAVTYPVLNSILGAATVPDLRGRYRQTLDQGTGRSVFPAYGAGGANNILQVHLPNYTLPNTLNVTPMNTVPMDAPTVGANAVYSPTGAANLPVSGSVTSGGGGLPYVPPTIVGGITMIRAA